MTLPSTLERVRADLVAAVEADLARTPLSTGRKPRSVARRSTVGAAAAAAVLGAAGMAAAAAYGPWTGPAAPPAVEEELRGLGRGLVGEETPVGESIEVARTGDRVLYAGPTAGGGYCVTTGAGRTGACAAVSSDEPLSLAAEAGPEGGTVFGRVADEGAVRVEIGLAGHQPLAVTIGTNGFFVAALPADLATSLATAPGESAPIGPVRAFDAAGQVVATVP